MTDGTQTKNEPQAKAFSLPSSLIGASDLSRLIRELETLDDFLYQTQIRTPGTPMQLPKTSRTLEDIASVNNYSLLEQAQRTQLLKGLKHLDTAAPVIHISFAAEASPSFASKIVGWLRQHVHQYLLVEVGLQPTVAVGCVVRTDNKIFDLSLRHKFSEYRQMLVDKLAEIEPQITQPATAEVKTEQPSKQPAETKHE